MVSNCHVSLVVFFFKQKTAYEMRISDWSSDVCSSDLEVEAQAQRMKMAEGRDRQLARRILPDALEHDVAQIVEQHPGKACAGIGEHQPDRERDTLLHPRSEEGRVGKECVSSVKSRWSTYN